MYSRSFYPEAEETASFPKNYDGTALLPPIAPQEPPAEHSAEDIREVSAPQGNYGSGLFSSLGHLPAVGELFGKLKFPSFGGEEILILAVAAMLFFSKEGDKECALILLFLLFIT